MMLFLILTNTCRLKVGRKKKAITPVIYQKKKEDPLEIEDMQKKLEMIYGPSAVKPATS